MGSAGASSKPIQDPPKFDFQAPPAVVSTSMAGADDQSKPKREQLSNPGTMDEINKKTKGNPAVIRTRDLRLSPIELISFRGYSLESYF